jgi:divalent metal cation (Fe/Co/Zn/Cd) transporter
MSPAPRTPLQCPVSLPIPTFKEFRASMTQEQKTRWAWCFCHLGVAAYVQMGAHESLSVTALSHLIFFDAIGAFLCMIVETSRNFEVWSRSTISRPFGLERSEVLAGLAMSITLLFMGFDLINHGLGHAFESSSGHTPHNHGGHSHHGLDSVNFAALLAIMSTLVSSSMLGNHSRIGRAIRIPFFDSLPMAARNPTLVLPISLASLVLILPPLGIHMSGTVDALLGFVYAVGMVILGWCLCIGVGRMLLMSYSGQGVKELTQEISNDNAVTGIQEAKVWQVHYGLCMANFKLTVQSSEHVERLRDRVVSLVKNRLGGGYGEGNRGVKWEVSTQITIER